MRRNNLIPCDTKILPLFLRQKGQKIKVLKDREKQLPFQPRQVLRKELIFPNNDTEWGRAWKSAESTTEFQDRLGHGHWQRKRLTRELITKECGRVENRENQRQNWLFIQNVVHKGIQTVHPVGPGQCSMSWDRKKVVALSTVQHTWGHWIHTQGSRQFPARTICPEILLPGASWCRS